MKTKQEKYVLAYGFRRYSACKKLGWVTIPSYIQDTEGGKNVLKDVPLEQIHVVDNTRCEKSDEGFMELMQSIKQHGLLEPIGLWEINALDTESFIVKNLIENIHREGITPFELSKACRELQKLGLNSGEIAVRLSLAKSKIDSIINLTASFPADTMKHAAFVNGKQRKGKIPISVLNRISHIARVSDGKGANAVKQLVTAVKDKGWGISDINLAVELVKGGIDIEKAINKKDDYVVITPTLVLNKKEIEKEGAIINTKYIRAVLNGKEKLNTKMFI